MDVLELLAKATTLSPERQEILFSLYCKTGNTEGLALLAAREETGEEVLNKIVTTNNDTLVRIVASRCNLSDGTLSSIAKHKCGNLGAGAEVLRNAYVEKARKLRFVQEVSRSFDSGSSEPNVEQGTTFGTLLGFLGDEYICAALENVEDPMLLGIVLESALFMNDPSKVAELVRKALVRTQRHERQGDFHKCTIRASVGEWATDDFAVEVAVLQGARIGFNTYTKMRSPVQVVAQRVESWRYHESLKDLISGWEGMSGSVQAALFFHRATRNENFLDTLMCLQAGEVLLGRGGTNLHRRLYHAKARELGRVADVGECDVLQVIEHAMNIDAWGAAQQYVLGVCEGVTLTEHIQQILSTTGIVEVAGMLVRKPELTPTTAVKLAQSSWVGEDEKVALAQRADAALYARELAAVNPPEVTVALFNNRHLSAELKTSIALATDFSVPRWLTEQKLLPTGDTNGKFLCDVLCGTPNRTSTLGAALYCASVFYPQINSDEVEDVVVGLWAEQQGKSAKELTAWRDATFASGRLTTRMEEAIVEVLGTQEKNVFGYTPSFLPHDAGVEEVKKARNLVEINGGVGNKRALGYKMASLIERQQGPLDLRKVIAIVDTIQSLLPYAVNEWRMYLDALIMGGNVNFNVLLAGALSGCTRVSEQNEEFLIEVSKQLVTLTVDEITFASSLPHTGVLGDAAWVQFEGFSLTEMLTASSLEECFPGTLGMLVTTVRAVG